LRCSAGRGRWASILAGHAAAEAMNRIDDDFDKVEKHVRPSGNRFL
jgi:hypothetical protein